MYIPLFFTALHYIIPAVRLSGIDNALIELDYWLFGSHPTVWMEKYSHPFLTDVMILGYSTFYILPLILVLPFFIQGRMGDFKRCSFIILLGYYTSYIGYFLFPALGPRFYLAHLQENPLQGWLIYEMVSHTLNQLENIQWDAFPSGHVTIALLFSYFAFQYFRKLFFISLPVILLLVISTVYLRYHYVIDVVAGIVLFLFCALVDRIMRKRFL
ncbi:MAG: hypothetical protein Kow0042_11000 [Calditrichia bacterium]